MDDQLGLAWEIRHYLVEGLLANVEKGAEALLLLGVSSPLLRPLIPPTSLYLPIEGDLISGSRVPLAQTNGMDEALLALGVADARISWPGIFRKATRYFMTNVPMEGTRAKIAGEHVIGYNVSERLNMDLYTGFTFKTELSCAEMREEFVAVRLKVGGSEFSNMPMALNMMLASRAGLLVDQKMGLTVVPVMFPPSVFPIIALQWHRIEIELVCRDSPTKMVPSPAVLVIEGIVVDHTTSRALRYGELADAWGTERVWPPLIQGFTAVDQTLGSFTADFAPAGGNYARVAVPAEFKFPCTGFIVTVNLPPALAHLIAPIKEAVVLIGGARVASFDLIDMAELNWIKAGEKGDRGNFELLLPFNRKGLMGKELCTINLSRGDTTFLFIFGVTFAFSATINPFMLNVRRTSNGMAGHRFSA
jgi:hypothetical protein